MSWLLCSPHQGYIYLIQNKEKKFKFKIDVFLFEYSVKWNLFIWCKAEFLASLVQFSVSRDLSEIILLYWFTAQETFLTFNVEI